MAASYAIRSGAGAAVIVCSCSNILAHDLMQTRVSVTTGTEPCLPTFLFTALYAPPSIGNMRYRQRSSVKAKSASSPVMRLRVKSNTVRPFWIAPDALYRSCRSSSFGAE
uniref:Putative secreted protein n=1 Tax=Anopheles darlingi TaxID=43151 RepID=A0A2M4DBG7_ANODA